MLDAPASNDLAWSTAHQLADEFASGHLNASTIIEAALTRIRSLDPSLNSFTAVTEQRAYHRAKELDDARERGERLGPLAGVPFAVKNLFDIAGLPTLAGSKINREQKPSQRDAALIERLERAGAILVGALNIRGLGRRRRRRLGAACARLGHQRLDPRTILMLRDFWAQTDLWQA